MDQFTNKLKPHVWEELMKITNNTKTEQFNNLEKLKKNVIQINNNF